MFAVENFSLCLDDFDQVLNAAHPVNSLEAALSAKLEAPVRLLRWAIVRVEKDETGLPCGPFYCEGAYLKATRS